MQHHHDSTSNLKNVIRNLKRILAIFLQAVPLEVDIQEIEEKLRAIDQVQSTHHTHIWSLDGEHHILTTHVVVNDKATRDEVRQVKQRIIDLVKDKDFEHITIEVEYADEDHRSRYHNE